MTSVDTNKLANDQDRHIYLSGLMARVCTNKLTKDSIIPGTVQIRRTTTLSTNNMAHENSTRHIPTS